MHPKTHGCARPRRQISHHSQGSILSRQTDCCCASPRLVRCRLLFHWELVSENLVEKIVRPALFGRPQSQVPPSSIEPERYSRHFGRSAIQQVVGRFSRGHERKRRGTGPPKEEFSTRAAKSPYPHKDKRTLQAVARASVMLTIEMSRIACASRIENLAHVENRTRSTAAGFQRWALSALCVLHLKN